MSSSVASATRLRRRLKRADVVLMRMAMGGRLIGDVAVACPLARSYISAAQDRGGAAARRTQQKEGKYAHLVAAEDSFTALVFESCGFMSAEVQQLITDTAEAYAEEHAESGDPRDVKACRDQFIADWQIRLSVVLQRGNAVAVRSRTSRDCAAAGRHGCRHHTGFCFE